MKFARLHHQSCSNSGGPDELISVHRAGCRDIRRDSQKHASIVDAVEFDSAEAVVEDWFDAEMVEMGWTAKNGKIHACCKKSSSS